MPDPVLTAASTLRCPHGGVATPVGMNRRVLVGGSPVLTAAEPAIVTGCANAAGPCAIITWADGNSRVLVSGLPVVTQGSTARALTANQVPAGAPTIAATAQRVTAG